MAEFKEHNKYEPKILGSLFRARDVNQNNNIFMHEISIHGTNLRLSLGGIKIICFIYLLCFDKYYG